ncbi:hypothetical protein RJ639_006246 [Escallonia herrerae]|uniref:Uncharacterized protein n=1 Tax=Escallonia herrerae TaxID=1293975 RepID=A0AA89AZM0_9ASTE|nr:hypothetical protein RJ639_006246 [Escallonia herrerae]
MEFALVGHMIKAADTVKMILMYEERSSLRSFLACLHELDIEQEREAGKMRPETAGEGFRDSTLLSSKPTSENVSESGDEARSVRAQLTFDPSFLEVGVPLVSFQEPKGASAKEFLTDKAQSPKPFDAHTLRSRLSSYDLKILQELCEIPPSIKLRLPDNGESANMTTLNEIGVYLDMFTNGFRVPIHPFYISVLNVYGLAPGQFSPHAWRFRLPKSQRFLFNNVWLSEYKTRSCNTLREKDLSDTELAHIKKLKEAKPLDSKYPLSNVQLRECGIIFSLNEDLNEEEEEEGENDPEEMSLRGDGSGGGSRVQGDPPLFNAQGVLRDIIANELASIHGIEEEALAQVQIGAEKLIVVDKVLDEERKRTLIEINFRREAKKKVKELNRVVERLERSKTNLIERIQNWRPTRRAQ